MMQTQNNKNMITMGKDGMRIVSKKIAKKMTKARSILKFSISHSIQH